MDSESVTVNIDASSLQALADQIISSNLTGVYLALLKDGNAPEDALQKTVDTYAMIWERIELTNTKSN